MDDEPLYATTATLAQSPKNIVICLDGTGNAYGSANTNVVKLFQMLESYTSNQIAFYDPGVGTFSAKGAWTRTSKWWTKVLGLAVGFGLAQTLESAYRYLMRTYNPNDRIFIFGFSRGAYAARALAGFLYKCGLLNPRLDDLIPYAFDIYRMEKNKAIVSGFQATFARPVRVHFLGLWDTVSSVGWVWNPTVLPYTRVNSGVDAVRHAVSIDERRAFFRSNQWGAPEGAQDVQQLWFAGVHSDVGGSYPEAESGLAQITLQWMVDEAIAKGMLVDPVKRNAQLPTLTLPYGSVPAALDPAAPQHESLRGWWWLAEVFPKLIHDPRTDFHLRPRINLGRRRFIPDDAKFHPSVVARWNSPALRYRPSNVDEELLLKGLPPTSATSKMST